MTQLPLDMAAEMQPAPAQFQGDKYVERFDRERLQTQIDKLREFMLAHPGAWFTIPELGRALNEPESSLSAQVRNLRKPEHGGWQTPIRRRGDAKRGCWEYTISPREES